MKSKLIMAAAVLGSSLMLAAGPAQARWHGHHGGWHHGGGAIGAGIAGFAAGAILGGLASQPGYYYGPGYGYYGPGYGDYAYEPAPGGGGVAYCEQRFRSYNPRTGLYLGYDGRHHPCP